MFGTPDKASKGTENLVDPSFLRRRLGSQAAASTCQADKKDLKKSLGYSGSSKTLKKEKALKKPAAAKAKKDPLKKEVSKQPSLKKDPGNKRMPWVKLRKTVAKKPARAYICGAHDTGNPGAGPGRRPVLMPEAFGGNRRLYAWTPPAADRPWPDLGSTLGRPPVALATCNFP